MGDGLDVATRTAGECLIVKLQGELDVTNAATAGQAISDAAEVPHTRLIFDLTGLAFMDSTGIRVLVRAHRMAGERGASVALVGPTPSVSRIIDITGLNRAFTIHATLDEVLASPAADRPAAEPAD